MTAYPAESSTTFPRLVSEGTKHGGREIPERLLAKLWKERAARQTGLRTEAGKRVRVVYPGRSAGTAGPDFRDALLEVEGLGLVTGDVELHIRQSDWNSHGHGGDPNYNGVVLHGALQVDSEETRLRSGGQAPVVDLRALLEEGPDQDLGLDPRRANDQRLDLWQVLARRDFSRPASMEEAGTALDRAGDLRFRLKSRWFSRCILADGPDQALYQALMEGLGYSSNRRPFIELALSAPYQAVAQAAGQLSPEERFPAIRGWLSACSGLSAAGATGPAGRSRPKGFGPAMNQGEWRLFRVRPANHPRRRIVGAASILDRFLEPGLAVGLGEIVEGVSPAKLNKALGVPGTAGPAFVGPGRAKDLAVNAVLPFMHAWAEARGHGPGPDAAWALYRLFPRLEDNELFREMAVQLLPHGWRSVVSTARRQQGLLHLSALLRGAH